MFALTDKLSFSMDVTSSSNVLATWKENMKIIAYVLYENIEGLKFKIDKVRNGDEAKKLMIMISTMPRIGHSTSTLTRLGTTLILFSIWVAMKNSFQLSRLIQICSYRQNQK